MVDTKVDQVIARFALLDRGEMSKQLQQITERQTDWALAVSRSFHDSVAAAMNVASVPFLMANVAAQDSLFQRIHIAERIRARSLVDGGMTHEAAEVHALRIAQEKFPVEVEKERENIADDTVNRLYRALSDDDFSRASSELLRETLVMLWGALEAFASEFVRSLVNMNPALAVSLTSKDPSKKHFPARGISLESLAEYQFRVDSAMGDLLFSERHLDSLPMLRDILSVLAPNAHELHEVLNDKRLWLMWQKRHLIVHKRGLVDSSYIAKTGDDAKIGEYLSITSADIKEYLKIIQNCGIQILSALAKK